MHRSGDKKPWDRDFLNPQKDETFALDLLKKNCDWQCKYWLERAGSSSDYAKYGIDLQDKKFQALRDQRTGVAQASEQNSIDDFISKGVDSTKAIAVKAVAAWRQTLIALPAALKYASLSVFLDKLKKGPIFFVGDKVSVRWYSDEQQLQYDGVLTQFYSHGWYWVEFLTEKEGAWIAHQDLNPISSASTDLGSQC